MKTFIAFIAAMAISFTSFAVTPAGYSTQLTTLNAGGILAKNSEGPVYVKYFSYTTTAISNQTVALVRIPANTRIIDGEISLAAQGGAQVFDLGLTAADKAGYINKGSSTADDVDLFLDGIANSNAVVDTFANLVAGDANALYAGYDTDVYLTITAPAGEAAFAADKAIVGWVQFTK